MRRASCDPERDPFTIGHILPENPVSEWEETFPPPTRYAAADRLGNLTLFESGPHVRRLQGWHRVRT